ncbi:hypothetical protein ACHAPQ_000031 [Fusarium lateritium]
MGNRRIVVSIDFGTTYSGVAWADTSRLDDPVPTTKDEDSAKDLTKVYLSCLHAHFISVLEKRLGPSVVRSTPMDFVVTVPAIWSPKAKQSTEQAAAMAGFCGNQRIQLISEPVWQRIEE